MKLRKHRPSPAMIVALLGLFVGLGGVGVAATGGNFILGQANSAGAKTSLTAGLSDRALAITNMNTGASATALGLNVAAGRPPLIVNSSTKVANLNADKLDGADSGAFVQRGGTILVSSQASNWTAVYPASVYHSGTYARINGGNYSGAAFLSPDLPVALYGRKLRLEGAQLCYDATQTALFLDSVTLTVYATGSDGASTVAAQFMDNTDQSDRACRLYNLPAPHVLQENEAVTLEALGKWALPFGLDLGRATFVLSPTNNLATPPG